MPGPDRDKTTEWLEKEGYSVEALDEVPEGVQWALVATEPSTTTTKSTVVVREELFYQIQRTTTISPGHAEALKNAPEGDYRTFLLDLSRDVVLAGGRIALHRAEGEPREVGDEGGPISGFTVYARLAEDRVTRESFVEALNTASTATLLAVFQVRKAAGQGP